MLLRAHTHFQESGGRSPAIVCKAVDVGGQGLRIVLHDFRGVNVAGSGAQPLTNGGGIQ
jgi:hypothetical protein